MKVRNLWESFNCAIEGFVYVSKTQKNMRIHFVAAGIILLTGFFLGLAGIELTILCCTIAFVLIAEMFNTAVEMVINLITDTYHPIARIAKDIGAGAVLIASINALIVGYVLFFKHFHPSITSGVAKLKQSPWHLTLLSLMIVIIIVILVKLVLKSGTPARGGMPSGHTATAFSIATVAMLYTIQEIPLVTFLVFLLAVMVARSRRGIHNVWEIASGAILGMIVTVLVFQLLR